MSFVFEHRFNTTKNSDVYVDVVVAKDCARNIEVFSPDSSFFKMTMIFTIFFFVHSSLLIVDQGIIDLRGYRCAVPDRTKAAGAAALLFKHLNHKGENPSFFGNTLGKNRKKKPDKRSLIMVNWWL